MSKCKDALNLLTYSLTHLLITRMGNSGGLGLRMPRPFS